MARGGHNTWTPSQMAQFLEIARTDRLYGMWVLAASTGMRRSELCGLRMPALDLDAATLRMTSTRVLAGNKVVTGRGKSKRSRRMLALDRFTVAVLRAHLERQAEEKAAFGDVHVDEGYVFTCEDGRPIHPQRITEMFYRVADRAGLPRIRLHDLRHSYATIALRSGVHPKIVSARLGHATVAFTLDTYSADIPDLDREAAENIIGLFLPPGHEHDR